MVRTDPRGFDRDVMMFSPFAILNWHPATPAPRARTSPTSVASVLAYGLAQRGQPVAVQIKHEKASAEEFGQKSRLTLWLRHALPFADLELAVRQFARSRHQIMMIIGTYEYHSPGYRERLHLGPDSAVLRLERQYRASPDEVPQNSRLLGVIIRRVDALSPPSRLMRRVMAEGHAIQICKLINPPQSFDPLANVLHCLGPEGRKALADDLGWQQIVPDVYASPDADVSPVAFLKGPLLIDPGIEIGPEDIHIGPAWLRHGTAAHTVYGQAVSGVGTSDTTFSAPPAHARYFAATRPETRPGYECAKRAFDITFAAIALLMLSPLMILAAIAIKLYDFGPIFFIHEREGLNGKPFGCIKFRTMVRNAEALKEKLKATNQVDGPQFKIARDPRITPLGRFLRKTNVDELPQFWNVLKGDMSLVGPRPSPYSENQLCPPWREARLSVKPGVTGLWQISRSRERGAADFQEWIYYDTQYVERRSFWLDIKIVLLTVKEILGKGQ